MAEQGGQKTFSHAMEIGAQSNCGLDSWIKIIGVA
jgi:hypothetical protein